MSDFSYTGGIQTFTVPYSGLYQLEVYGAEGGYYDGSPSTGGGGYGGYAKGYKYFDKGDVLYVCVGAVGHNHRNGDTGAPYNNNRTGRSSGYSYGWGGGATHIATMTGELAQIGSSNLSKVLIVAGGGGAKYSSYAGGTGGGTNGGSGGGSGGGGGTQSGGFGFGAGADPAGGYTGGGAGLYGGWRGGQYAGGAGGGSGYTGGVPSVTYKGTTYSPSMTNGTRSGNGFASITLIEKAVPTCYFGDIPVQTLYYGDIEVSALFYGDEEVQ